MDANEKRQLIGCQSFEEISLLSNSGAAELQEVLVNLLVWTNEGKEQLLREVESDGFQLREFQAD